MALTINITNFSKHDFNGWGKDYYQTSLSSNDGENSIPSKVIEKMAGQTKMEVSQNMLKEFGSDVFQMNCEYINEQEHWFGVLLKQNAQVFEIGPRPSWQVLTEGNKWQDQETAKPYIWEYSDVTITATPSSSHTSLSIDVVIKNKD